MYNGPDVRFIDTHPKCNCSHNTLEFIFQEPVVCRSPLARGKPSMVAFAFYPSTWTINQWSTGIQIESTHLNGPPILSYFAAAQQSLKCYFWFDSRQWLLPQSCMWLWNTHTITHISTFIPRLFWSQKKCLSFTTMAWLQGYYTRNVQRASSPLSCLLADSHEWLEVSKHLVWLGVYLQEQIGPIGHATSQCPAH